MVHGQMKIIHVTTPYLLITRIAVVCLPRSSWQSLRVVRLLKCPRLQSSFDSHEGIPLTPPAVLVVDCCRPLVEQNAGESHWYWKTQNFHCLLERSLMGKLSGLRQCLSLSSQSKVLSAAVRMIAEPEVADNKPSYSRSLESLLAAEDTAELVGIAHIDH